MAVHRGSTPCIETASEREERRHLQLRKAEEASRAETARISRLFAGREIANVVKDDCDVLWFTFRVGARVRIEPSEWLTISEEKA